MTNYYDIPTVDETHFAASNFETWLKNELVALDKYNQAAYQDALRKDRQLMTLVSEVYGEKSATFKYMNRQRVETPPDLQRRAKKIWRKFEDWRYAEQQRAKRQDYRRRSQAANLVLQELGYVPGEHYSPTRAITFGKQVINPNQPDVRMLPGGERS